MNKPPMRKATIFVLSHYLAAVKENHDGFYRHVRYEFGDAVCQIVIEDLARLGIDIEEFGSMRQSEYVKSRAELIAICNPPNSLL